MVLEFSILMKLQLLLFFRVDKPKRSEPYLDVSEYHLASSETNADSNKVEVYDLVKVLERKSSQKQIKSKFESVLNRSSKLPKPLEKVFEDKVCIIASHPIFHV